MSKKYIVSDFIKLGIRTWIKTITTKIKIESLNLSLNKEFFGRIDNLYLEATKFNLSKFLY